MKTPLRQQITAVQLELEIRKGVRAQISRGAEREFQAVRLEAALATLQWLQANETRIRSALAEEVQ